MKHFKNSRTLVIVTLSLLICSFVSMADADEIALYVSPSGNDSWAGDNIDKPFATLQKARDAIRAMKKKDGLTKPVTVYLRGGTYELSETLVFTLEDSGTKTCPITYRAYQNEKPIISGGRKIDGSWKKYKGEIMVCTIPEVKKGNWRFRQLFLNGERQTRARIPNLDESFIKGEKLFQIDEPEEDLGKYAMKYQAGHFKKFKNLNDVEVVLYRTWNESRLLVFDLDEDERIVTFTGLIGRRLRSNQRYYIDNVLEGLDQPGEWYLDRHTGELYYWPVEGGKLSELRAPVINELVRFEGDVEGKKHVQYINIRGLTFIDTDYILPKEGIPPIRDPGDIWFPSAITLKGVSNCVFEDNTIRNVGTYGLDLTGDGNRIRGNIIYDTGSGGIIIRSYGRDRNIISYNHIHHCGFVLHAAVGINIDDGGGLIANNLIHDISHSGIYTRHFASDYGQEPERRNQEQGLIIEYNEIYDVMLGSNDGGGIFVRDHYITIRNNFIHDSRGNGIYLGCETRNCLVENNVLCRTRTSQVVWFLNKNVTIFNNIYIDGNPPVSFTNYGGGYHKNIKFLRNIISFSNPNGIFVRADEESLPLESDYNLIYHTTGKDLVINRLPGVETYEDWQNLGYDNHSIVADPLFVDPENNDYSLRPDSPALKLGFKPIGVSMVGLRGRR
ncbi:right-handed parallel beta-helix repeat-containing protein [Candidatus Pacearchaeota archaeon]|nr:right-handed parallel beta-helix repeat-containing protein [Candidatus Pacearchaeota archaeon]